MYIIMVNFTDIFQLTCTLFQSNVFALKYDEFDYHDFWPPLHINKYGNTIARCRSNTIWSL